MAAAGGKWSGGTFLNKGVHGAKTGKDLAKAREAEGKKLKSKIASHAKASKAVEAAQAAVAKSKISHRGRRAASEGLKSAQAVQSKREAAMNRQHDVFSRVNDTYHAERKNIKDAKAGVASRRNRRISVINTAPRKRKTI